MTSQHGKQTIAINVVPQNSRIKGNQTMKFCHLIEYNIRSIFLKKLYTNCGGKPIPRTFSEKMKIEHISGSIV